MEEKPQENITEEQKDVPVEEDVKANGEAAEEGTDLEPLGHGDGKKHGKKPALFSKNRTLKLAMTGMLTALTMVVTWILPIPMAATEGYINFGDAVIFITAAAMGPIPAMIVGGLGSMLADILGGYVHWALFTLVIKGLEGLFCGLLVGSMKTHRSLSSFIAMFVSAVWMVVAYYFAGALMYGLAGSFASVPGNLLQGGVSVAVGYSLTVVFGKIKSLQPFLERLK